MKKQFAVFGLGSFGMSVAVNLQRLGCEVIAVDEDEQKVKAVASKVSYALVANVGSPDLHEIMGTKNLDGVVVAVAEMEASILATMVSKERGVPVVIAKAKNELHEKVLKKVGADYIIYPEQEMGERIARSVLSKSFSDWIALSDEYSMVEVAAPRKWIGKSLRELDVRKNWNVNVVGTKMGEKVEVNTDPDAPLSEGVILILVGANEDLEKI